MTQNPYESSAAYALSNRTRPAVESIEFSVNCECGATIAISASQAGGVVTCRCGRDVRVPRLSQLRTAKGLAAHETSIRDSIARMIRDGALPWGQCCAVTGMPTDDVMWFDVQCERSYLKSERRWGITLIIVSLLLPFGLFLRLLGITMLNEDPERRGHDISIAIPLRVRKDSQSSLRNWAGQRRLRKLLCGVPIYQQLFQEHKSARIAAR
jgi:hypothetical protein